VWWYADIYSTVSELKTLDPLDLAVSSQIARWCKIPKLVLSIFHHLVIVFVDTIPRSFVSSCSNQDKMLG